MYARQRLVGIIGLANKPGGYTMDIVGKIEPLIKIASIMMLSVKIQDKRVAAMTSLEVTNEKLQQKSQELEQFAYIASHDLKEPLNAITGYSNILMSHTNGMSEQCLDLIERIEQTTQRMRTLIDDLLAYSRATADEYPMHPVDLNAILLSVQEVLSTTIKKKAATLEWHHLPTIQGIFPQMEQVFQNIIENALKYQLPNTSPHITITASEETQKIVITIQDNGIGIDKAYFEQIFKPFKRLHTRSEFAGSGIGLSICKKIMLAHGGNIQVESKPSEGSSFHLIFPLK